MPPMSYGFRSVSSRLRVLHFLAWMVPALVLGGPAPAHAQSTPTGNALRAARIAFAPAAANPYGLTVVGSRSKPALVDLDGDGDLDGLVGNFDGNFVYFENTAGPGATPAYAPYVVNPFGLSDIGGSSAPSVVDLDGDGDLDVLAGEINGNLFYFANTAGPGATPAFAAPVLNPFGLSIVSLVSTPAPADLDGDGDMDVLVGDLNGVFHYFQNTAGPSVPPVLAAPVVNPFGLSDIGSFSAPALGDLDGDGDLDLLSGERDGNFFYFENTAGPGQAPAFVAPLVNPFGLSNVDFFAGLAVGDLEGDGDLDVLAGASDGNLRLFENTGDAPLFASPVQNPFGLSGTSERVAPALADIDGDGDVDLLAGGLATGLFYYYQNTAGAGATPVYAAAVATPFGLTASRTSIVPAIADVDGDGDLDVLIGEDFGNFVYHQNTAAPGASPAYAPPVLNPFGLTKLVRYSTPEFGDFDGDGDFDLLAGDWYGNFSYFENTAAPGQAPAFAAPLPNPFGLGDIGDFSAPRAGDFDFDGDLDVLAGGFDGNFYYFENTAGPDALPAFAVPVANPFGLTAVGGYNLLAVADLDGNGSLDVLRTGNNFSFFHFRNTSETGVLTATITGAAGWRLLAAPGDDATLGDLLEPLWTQGFPGADYAGGQTNVKAYTESVPGDLDTGFAPPVSQTQLWGAGTGRFVYVFADDDAREPGTQGGFPKTLSVAARPPLTSFAWGAGGEAPLSFTDTGSPADDGWNLLGNPFASWFDWDAVDLAGVNAPVYVYDHATAGYRSHVRGLPNAGTLPGGIVGPFQGFWVQASAASPSLTARAGVSNGGPLYRSGAAEATVVGLRLRPGEGTSLPAGIESQTFLALGVNGAETGREGLDAVALVPPAGSYVLLSSVADGADGSPVALSIDARPAAEGAVTVALDVSAVAGGAPAGAPLVLDWPDLSLPAGWTARLHDGETGTVTELSEGGSHAFTLAGAAPVAPVVEVLTVPLLGVAPVRAEALTGGRFTLVVTPPGVVSGEAEAPAALSLSAPRPNPTAGGSSLVLALPEAGSASVAVYDALGRRVAVLAEGVLGAGEHTLRLASGVLASGTYVVRAEVGGQVLTQRLTVTR